MKLRLTKAGRAVLFIALIVVLGVGGFFGYQHFVFWCNRHCKAQ